MNETSISTVSEILESFDMNELRTLLKAQIENDDNDYTSTTVDHFQPIYMNYQRLLENANTDDQDSLDALDYFQKVCQVIINLLEKKFQFDIDDQWLEDHARDIPAITMALYSFFILDFQSNLKEIIINYFTANISDLANTFMELGAKHDAATLAIKKKGSFSEKMVVLSANMYDVTDYILTQLDVDSGLEYLDDGYWPANVLREMYNNGYVDGDFLREFADIYKSNTALKAQISFDIQWKIHSGEIRDPFI